MYICRCLIKFADKFKALWHDEISKPLSFAMSLHSFTATPLPPLASPFLRFLALQAAEKQLEPVESIKRRTSGPEGRDHLIDFITGDKSPAYHYGPTFFSFSSTRKALTYRSRP